MYRACPWSSWTIPADIVVETWVKNCTARFYNHSIGMRSYLLKSNFKFNLQKHHFVYVYEVIIKCYLNFITCLYFPLALIRWSSSHCHLMELFKSKESYKEKFDSNNNWKTAWPRMILKWHLFLRLLLGFEWKLLNFVGKHLWKKFLLKKCLSVRFLYFLFKWKGVQLTGMSNKVCRKWNVSLYLSQKKERSKNIIQLQKYLKNFH